MIWQSITIDVPRCDDEIATALAAPLGLARERICIVRDLRELLAEPDPDIELVCERTELSGDFALQLTLIAADAVIERWISRDDELALSARICERLGANCLLDGDGPNPYEAIYLPLRGTPRRVFLDVQQLDEFDAVVIQPEPATTAN